MPFFNPGQNTVKLPCNKSSIQNNKFVGNEKQK